MDCDLGFTISRSTCSSSPLKAKSSFCQVGPQSGTGESILDPLPYIVQGKNVYLATMSVPITVNGKFAGVAGADFDHLLSKNWRNRSKLESMMGRRASKSLATRDWSSRQAEILKA